MSIPIAKKPAPAPRPVTFKSVVDTGKKAVKTGLSVKKAVTDGFEAAKSVKTNGLGKAYGLAKKSAAEAASNPTGKLNLLGKLKLAGGAVGTVTGLATLPGKVGTAVSDIRKAVRSGSAGDLATAAQSTIGAAKDAASTAKAGLSTGAAVSKLASSYKAGKAAFEAAVPTASKAVSSAAARAAMKSTFEGVTRGAVKGAATEAALAAAKKSGGTVAKAITGSAGRAVAKAALREGGKAAGEAALKAGARAAATGLGKAAARFTPGLNIAIAALDTANAIATVRDPNASTGKKVTSVITAVGSIAAATNIPVVSQVGAAVSAVSGFIGSFF